MHAPVHLVVPFGYKSGDTLLIPQRIDEREPGIVQIGKVSLELCADQLAIRICSRHQL